MYVSGFLPSPQSINSFKFNHAVLKARESPDWGNTVQKCLITAAFQIKWRRCIIQLWRIPCEWGPAGKQEVCEVFLSAVHLTISSYTQFCVWDPGETMQHSLTYIRECPGGLFFQIRPSLLTWYQNLSCVHTHFYSKSISVACQEKQHCSPIQGLDPHVIWIYYFKAMQSSITSI